MMGCLCPRKPSPVRQWSRPSLPGTRGGSQWPQAGEGTGPGHCAPRSGWAEPWEPPRAAELTWVRPGRSLTGRRVGWARPPWRRVMWWTAGWMRARWSRWGSRRPSHLWEGVGTGLSPHPSALTSGPTGGSQPAGWGGRGGLDRWLAGRDHSREQSARWAWTWQPSLRTWLCPGHVSASAGGCPCPLHPGPGAWGGGGLSPDVAEDGSTIPTFTT